MTARRGADRRLRPSRGRLAAKRWRPRQPWSRVLSSRRSDERPLPPGVPERAHRAASGLADAAGRAATSPSTARCASGSTSSPSAARPSSPPRSPCSRCGSSASTPRSSSPTSCCRSTRWAPGCASPPATARSSTARYAAARTSPALAEPDVERDLGYVFAAIRQARRELAALPADARAADRLRRHALDARRLPRRGRRLEEPRPPALAGAGRTRAASPACSTASPTFPRVTCRRRSTPARRPSSSSTPGAVCSTRGGFASWRCRL